MIPRQPVEVLLFVPSTHTRDIQYVTIYLPCRMLPVCTDVAHRRAILAFSDFIAVGGDKCRLVGGTAHGQARDNSSRACASALFSVRLSEPLVDIIHTSKSRLLSTCYCLVVGRPVQDRVSLPTDVFDLPAVPRLSALPYIHTLPSTRGTCRLPRVPLLQVYICSSPDSTYDYPSPGQDSTTITTTSATSPLLHPPWHPPGPA